MKKRFASLALLLLLLICIAPVGAHADQYCNLGQVQTGEAINCHIASVPSGSSFSHDSLPAGCRLTSNESNGVIHLYLSGVPTQAGSFSFTVNSGDVSTGKLICSLSVKNARPELYVSENVSCYLGDSVRISVSASVSGSTRYQWFSSASPNSGSGTPIAGANSAEYLFNASTAGTRYYYCQVSIDGYETVTSSSVSVTVSQPVVESIMVSTMPAKTRYTVGEALDAAGLTISVRLSGGQERLIDRGFELSPTILDRVGTQNINVGYQGKHCAFPVTVLSEEESITGIGMVNMPAKTEYSKGDYLDTTGLVFRVFYEGGSYKDLNSGFTCEPMQLTGSGSQNITLKYKNKTCTFPITVKETASLLEVTSTPRKLSYTVGESLDTAGLVLRLTKGGDTQIINSGFTCEPTVFTGSGTQVIKVRYDNLLATFTVTVKAAAASPSPAVTARPSPGVSAAPSASPVSPAPSSSVAATARPDRIEHDSYNTRSNRTTLIVIMVLAILCLIVLGALMLVMNAGGMEQLKARLSAFMGRFGGGRREQDYYEPGERSGYRDEWQNERRERRQEDYSDSYHDRRREDYSDGYRERQREDYPDSYHDRRREDYSDGYRERQREDYYRDERRSSYDSPRRDDYPGERSRPYNEDYRRPHRDGDREPYRDSRREPRRGEDYRDEPGDRRKR